MDIETRRWKLGCEDAIFSVLFAAGAFQKRFIS